jgi:hypothetical protein
MNVGRQSVVSLALSVLLFSTACSHKKPPTLPKRAQVPTIVDQQHDQIPRVPVPAQATEQAQVETPPPPPKTQTNNKKSRRNTTTAKKSSPPPATTSPTVASTPTPPPAQVQNNAPETTTVAVNKAPEPAVNAAIAADVSSADASHQKQTTAQLIQSTENNVKNLNNNNLNDDQKGMVTQIWSFIAQSKKATSEGDLERAYNLANKAHLLSEALITK